MTGLSTGALVALGAMAFVIATVFYIILKKK
jgi:hypothetical protein